MQDLIHCSSCRGVRYADMSPSHTHDGNALMLLSTRFSLLVCGLLLSLSQSGCLVLDRHMTAQDQCTPEDVLVERGEDYPLIDGVGWVVGIPSKILLWNRRVDNHHISPETEEQVRQYMAQNGLQDTQVRLNQYAPGAEWRRLVQNQHVAPGWRYTFGALDTLGYTLLPGRIFGGDRYNPYTNSVYVYSDVPALGQVSGAYAKDVNSRTYPGTYVFTQSFAGFNMIHETINTRDVLAYSETNSTAAGQREAQNILSPRYGLALGSTSASFVNINPANGALELIGVLGGHAVGRYRSSQITDDASQVETVSHEESSSRPRNGQVHHKIGPLTKSELEELEMQLFRQVQRTTVSEQSDTSH